MLKKISNWLVNKYEVISMKVLLVLIPVTLFVVAYDYSVNKLADYMFDSLTKPFFQ